MPLHRKLSSRYTLQGLLHRYQCFGKREKFGDDTFPMFASRGQETPCKSVERKINV